MSSKANIDAHEEAQRVVAETVSRTDRFFRENAKIIYSTLAVAIVLAASIVAYDHFVLAPGEREATDQMVQAERWFLAGDYAKALSGDGNNPGLEEILSSYGKRAGEAVYLYAGVAKLHTGDYDGAIACLGKYEGEDPILRGRAYACIGDAWVEKGQPADAIAWFRKAADATGNALAAGYLVKAGLAAEAAGDRQRAIGFYREVKDQWGFSPEAMEIDKYIAHAEYSTK